MLTVQAARDSETAAKHLDQPARQVYDQLTKQGFFREPCPVTVLWSPSPGLSFGAQAYELPLVWECSEMAMDWSVPASTKVLAVRLRGLGPEYDAAFPLPKFTHKNDIYAPVSQLRLAPVEYMHGEWMTELEARRYRGGRCPAILDSDANVRYDQFYFKPPVWMVCTAAGIAYCRSYEQAISIANMVIDGRK